MTENNIYGRTPKRSARKNRKLKTILFFICLAVFLTALFIYAGFSIYYTSHFYNGTVINGLNGSNMTVKEVEELLTRAADDYVLSLELRGDRKEQIAGQDIDLIYLVDDSVANLKEDQKGILWLFSSNKNKDYEYDFKLHYDEEKLQNLFNNLECLDENTIVMPKDAYLSDYEDGKYSIIEAEYGNFIKRDELFDLVMDSIYQLTPVINLDEQDCYVNPELTSDSDVLINLRDKMNQYLSSVITYHFGDVTEVVDHTVINKWLTVDKNYEAVIDPVKVREYVDYLGKNYNTFGMSRTFKTSYDKTITVKGGDYGWWMNRVAETEQLTAAVEEGTQGERTPVYYQKAAKYGKDDIGDTYVEINLSAQHLFYYKDGELLVESDFVSGNVSKRYSTPTGTYPLVYKEREATLVGEDYETPVSYWMPFNGNIGMHDAGWRTKFGGEIYLTKGSHGCVNLPPEVAKLIYENIEPGTAVICYKIKGTETKEITDLNKPKEAKEANSR